MIVIPNNGFSAYYVNDDGEAFMAPIVAWAVVVVADPATDHKTEKLTPLVMAPGDKTAMPLTDEHHCNFIGVFGPDEEPDENDIGNALRRMAASEDPVKTGPYR